MLAGGNKQCGAIYREESSYSTVMIGSVLLTSTIDSEEVIDVAIIDIPNIFIQKRIEDE